ncbi:MAG: inorganic diphosphatase [Acholeplasmatales bacterium]|jgi:inorganic pyrophosphatase|nr:inorganic diphosphatase [Acholeplasmatales bacterium]
MNILHDLGKERVTPEKFIAVIEISKGSKKKYELDKQTGMIILDRVLFTSTHYPANYGFIPLTHAEDNDPLDVLVLCSEDIEPLCMVECYPIGIIKMIDQDSVDEKIIAVPFKDPAMSNYTNISELPHHVITEIKHFFEVYKTLENKTTAILDTKGPAEAKEIIRKCMEEYSKKFKEGK